MKRILTVLAATLTLVVPLAAPSNAQNHDRRDNNRHDNDGNNWDPSQHNGYMWRGRWHYGRPPANVIGQRGYSVGWHQWRRGERVPSELRTRYVVVNDWRSHRLRPPPRGYHWVRDDRGEYILVGIATGLILSAILNNS